MNGPWKEEIGDSKRTGAAGFHPSAWGIRVASWLFSKDRRLDRYIYTSFRRKRKAATRLYRAKKTREKRADCLLIISWIVDLEKGRENIENIRRNVEILASVRMYLTVDKKVSIYIDSFIENNIEQN